MADTVDSNQEFQDTIEVLVREGRTFPPPPEFTAQAIIQDNSVYEEAERDYEGFWLRRAKEFVEWFKEPTRSLEWDPPHCTWFADGELNVAYNCLDKQVNAGRGDKVAYHWVSEPVDEPDESVTFAQLKDEVCRLANGLREIGVRKGDRVGLYMGMVPQLPIAMLACARLGAPHVVVFGGFSPDSLGERLSSTGCKAVVTQDEAWRRGTRIPLKDIADKAVQQAPTVERMVVYRRTGAEVPMQEGRDVWWHDLVEGKPAECEPQRCKAEDILYMLHTSGTTAKPKAAVHTTGGYLTYVSVTHKWIFDVHDDDIWWCAADVGWVTGHSYIVYGPLNNGVTGILYEGDPAFPEPDRHWQIVERYKVREYYTAPTLIRTLWQDDERFVSNYFSAYGPSVYFAGDGAKQDEDGYYWLLGRIDDVMNVSGHRLSTIELESALVAHPAVAEAAVCAALDELTGQTPLAFVLLRGGTEPSDELAKELREWVGERIGKIARPKAVIFGSDLPKTRSGKIMRRLLKNIAGGESLGDTTTLRDPAVVEQLKHEADQKLGREES